MKQLIFLFLLFLPVFSFAQKNILMPPAVVIENGMVLDSATKTRVKADIKITWEDSSKIFHCNGAGLILKGNLFYHTVPDSLIITSADPVYHVSKYKVKKLEWGKVEDANGKPTGEMWYMVELNVTVAKNKE